MNNPTLIPVVPTTLNGQTLQMVDARLLHEFLHSRQDYSTWIKSRIAKYGFEPDVDYLLHKFMEQVPHQGGWRATERFDYFLTIGMAKELAMVERSAKGRQARRYFLDCEHQLRQLQQRIPVNLTKQPTAISRGQRQAINRQAWADVSGQAQTAFHARREQLLRECIEAPKYPIARPHCIPVHLVPLWAR
ncbi:MAG: antA/AntB antirepressor family protein [Burkholderiaceae bacterium]